MYDNLQPMFADEKQAHDYLARWISPWFRFEREVILQHRLTRNKLRIDFLVTPEAGVDFPFDLFGIEVKASTANIGEVNRAFKQAIDYTSCEIVDKRKKLDPVRGFSIQYVYVFPAPHNPNAYPDGWHGGSERLAGLFRVGLIYTNWHGNPQFRMSAERQWDADNGGRRVPIHTRIRVGSGVVVTAV